ncbi:MAG: hypothetical protein WDM88_11465 [Galbitalea sp.]
MIRLPSPPELFTQFVDWLGTQSATENTVVKTVAQVIGGPVQPAVVVPPSASSANVTNPGLETIDAGGLPDCWAQAGYGTNTATFDTVSPGHTGNVAGRLTMTAYTDGDEKREDHADPRPRHLHAVRRHRRLVSVEFLVHLHGQYPVRGVPANHRGRMGVLEREPVVRPGDRLDPGDLDHPGHPRRL